MGKKMERLTDIPKWPQAQREAVFEDIGKPHGELQQAELTLPLSPVSCLTLGRSTEGKG